MRNGIWGRSWHPQRRHIFVKHFRGLSSCHIFSSVCLFWLYSVRPERIGFVSLSIGGQTGRVSHRNDRPLILHCPLLSQQWHCACAGHFPQNAIICFRFSGPQGLSSRHRSSGHKGQRASRQTFLNWHKFLIRILRFGWLIYSGEFLPVLPSIIRHSIDILCPWHICLASEMSVLLPLSLHNPWSAP